MDYVSREWIDAGAHLLEEFDKRYPVKAAFWLKEADDPFWYLYIASDHVNDTNLKDAYGEVLDAAKAMHDPNLDPFRVKLQVRPEWVQAAMDIQGRFPVKTGTRFHGGTFGGYSVDEVYIYPTPIMSVPPAQP
jgi:hypothetical protein